MHVCDESDVMVPGWLPNVYHAMFMSVCTLLHTHIPSCFYMSVSVFTALFGIVCLWFCKTSFLGSLFSPRGTLRVADLFVFGVVVSLCSDSGSLVHAICHFVSCCDFGLFVCVFVLIIMGCSLLLSHFLFIALILALGSSLTSQGCLRCGNQGRLYLSEVRGPLLTFDLTKVNCSVFFFFLQI